MAERPGKPLRPREWRRLFWLGLREGLSIERAAAAAGVSTTLGRRWFRQAGGVNPYASSPPLSGRYLSFAEREEIALGVAAGDSRAAIARRLGRAPSTITRELQRNHSGRDRQRRWAYLAGKAQQRADQRARRPKPSKLARDPRLRRTVQGGLDQRWSPEEIAARLRMDFPDDDAMRISHESIYRAIYVQGRGQLKRELVATLRTGRALRKPRRKPDQRRSRTAAPFGGVNISSRPAEAADRAVPGHWEGDLIMGTNNASAIGTLVERTTRFTVLLHLTKIDSGHVADALTQQVQQLPAHLTRSLAWDQGYEMAQHGRFTVDTGVQVYFCDPHSPWQRGTNENTNGLLREYFPKHTSLKRYTLADLNAVADQLNRRPRKTLGWRTPAEAFDQLLSQPQAASSRTIATAP